ncbi:unnamed protein product [Paramecium pentaurelia]|uniref:DUF4200 domain-containing protein n=1 Tax=Paramecium pentaurelia TaxID=43138 RepID=A0A8S1UVB3_9CILI|nr:unnamed protein product [Paramecium pentaurelia]
MIKDDNYEREFELKELEIETKNAVQFQDLLNGCIAHNLFKRKELFETFEFEEEEKIPVLQDLDSIRVMTEQMQTMQKNLQSKYTLIKRTKLLFEKRVNQLRETLMNIRVKDFEVNDDSVIKELHQANKRMMEFQQLSEKFRKTQQKRQEYQQKELEHEQEQLRKQQQQIIELKMENQKLLDKIQQLDLEEQEKRRKLYECFQTSEYIEFFTEVQMLQQDKEVSTISNGQSRQLGRDRQSTRHEIVTMMDEFYNNQNIHKLSEEITDFYRSMVEQLKVQTQTYNSLIEEKALKKLQLEEVVEESCRLKDYNCNTSQQDMSMINQDGLVNVAVPQVMQDNNQLSNYVKQNQMCLLSIHMKAIDMISRMCIGLIWLSETSKIVPKSLDNLCSQYLKGHSKADIKLFIPKKYMGHTKPQKYGSFISIINRNKNETSPKGSSTNIVTTSMNNVDKSIENEQLIQCLTRFKQMKNGYEQIQIAWMTLVKNDILTYKFVKDFNFDQIEINQPISDIILQLHIVYAEIILKINYFQHYEYQFAYFRDIVKIMNQSKQKINTNITNNSHKLCDSTHLSSSYTPNKFIEATYKGQLKRLTNPPVEEEEPIFSQNNVKKIQKTSDETKFHQFFIQQSSIIQRKSPLLHEKLISQTLQTIDQMRKKELDDNYQTSDQAASDNDYLNQERRNLKGMLNKKSQQQQQYVSKSEEKDLISSRSIMKQVSLLSKISHLSRVNSNQNYIQVNKSIQRLNQTVQKKISEYFTQDTNYQENRIRYPPIEKKISSRSPELQKKQINDTFNKDLSSLILNSTSNGRSFMA